jgi:hypothetical protein
MVVVTMKPLYFKVFPHSLPLEQLQAKLGAFDPNELDEKDRGNPDAVAKARTTHDQGLVKRSLADPSYGRVGAVGYRHPDGTFALETGHEPSLLGRFWEHYARYAGDMAGWGIMDGDLHWLLVRSWANQVKVPAAAKRNAGNGRLAWIGFVDLKRELAGGPARNLDLDRVLKAFGWEGEKASPTSGDGRFHDPDAAGAQKARADVEDDLRQLHDLGVRLGLESPDWERMPPVRGELPQLAGDRGPTTLDIETQPGELARLKEICGEFDPARVKTGHAKKAEKIQEIIAKARASYDENLQLESLKDPFLGRVCAMGYRDAAGGVDIPELGEKALLEDFWVRYERGERFNGWNLFEFDLFWIFVRSLLLNVRVPPGFRTRAGTGYARYHGITDLMREYTGAPGRYASLQSACDAFGLQGKNGDGANFHKFWNSPDPAKHQEGRVYLTNDVVQEAAVAHCMGFDQPPPAMPPPVDEAKADPMAALEEELFAAAGAGPEVR